MKRYVAFLRGINVAGQKLIKMDRLKEIMAIPGFKNIVIYIQSGNIAFDAKETDNALLKEKIEKKLLKELGYAVPAIVRSVDELKTVIDNNPFTDIAENDGRSVYVTFLTGVPVLEKHASLAAYIGGEEKLVIKNSEVYVLTRAYGNTKLTMNLMEKKLGHTATTRNWNTINEMITL